MDQHSSNSEKVAFFRSMFAGRKNVFARRFESAKTGKKGYSPYCENLTVLQNGVRNKRRWRVL